MRRGLWYFLSAQKVQTKDELLENIRQSIIYDRTTEKQAERNQLHPFGNHLPAMLNEVKYLFTIRCLACARHDTVQGLWVNIYIIAIIYRDLSSRTHVRDLIFRDIFQMSRVRSTRHRQKDNQN